MNYGKVKIMRKGFPLFAVLLILLGSFMLLDRAGVVTFGWLLVFWLIVTVFGGFKIVRGMSSASIGEVFWGTVFFFVGFYNVASDVGILYLPGGVLFPAFLLVMGLGLLLGFVSQPREWHLLVPALIFTFVGGLMTLAEMELLGPWTAIDTIKQWWPVGLILFGAALLLNAGARHQRSTQ
jgi:hypothetical protein